MACNLPETREEGVGKISSLRHSCLSIIMISTSNEKLEKRITFADIRNLIHSGNPKVTQTNGRGGLYANSRNLNNKRKNKHWRSLR